MNHNYGEVFDIACSKYPHYLDTVIDGLEVIKVGKEKWNEEDESKFVSVHSNFPIQNKEVSLGYTALEDDLFVPKG